MSVVSPDCCHGSAGHGVRVEVDAGKMVRARDERPLRPCRALARSHDRLMKRVRGLRAALTNRRVTGTGDAA